MKDETRIKEAAALVARQQARLDAMSLDNPSRPKQERALAAAKAALIEATGYATITTRLGVWVGTTEHADLAEAEAAARAAIESGAADSAAVWTDAGPVAYFGSGR